MGRSRSPLGMDNWSESEMNDVKSRWRRRWVSIKV